MRLKFLGLGLLLVLSATGVKAAGDDAPPWLQQAAKASLPVYEKDLPAVVLQREQHVTVSPSTNWEGSIMKTTSNAVFRFTVSMSLAFLVTLSFVAGPRTVGSQNCCVLPTAESTAYIGPFHITTGLFAQTISDSSGTNFDGRRVTESAGSTPVSNGCDWGGWPFPAPSLSGGTWVVGSGQVGVQTNHWGWDNVGYEPEVIDAIRGNGFQEGLMFPCQISVYQNMSIECTANAGDYQVYETNILLSTTIELDFATITNCRKGTCGSISY